MSNFLYIYEYTVYLGLKLLIINIVFAYCLAFLYGSTCLMTAFNILPEQVTHVLSPVLSHLTCKIIHTVHDPDRLSSLSLYTLSRLVASSSLSESSTTKQVKRYTGSDVRSCNSRSLVAHWRLFWQGGRTHSLAQPEWMGSAPDLCSAPYAGQQFSAAPIPATAPDRQWATGAAYRFIKPQPKHTEPHPFPYRWRPHTFTQRQWTSLCSHNIFYTIIIFYSHLASMPFLLVSQLPLCVLCYFLND